LLIPTRRTISAVPTPSAANNTTLARRANPARIDGDRVQETSTSRSLAETSNGTVNGMHHHPTG
jgi:hypothetical protein